MVVIVAKLTRTVEATCASCPEPPKAEPYRKLPCRSLGISWFVLQDKSRVSIRVGCFCTKHRNVKEGARPRIETKDMAENDSAAYAAAGRHNK